MHGLRSASQCAHKEEEGVCWGRACAMYVACCMLRCPATSANGLRERWSQEHAASYPVLSPNCLPPCSLLKARMQ